MGKITLQSISIGLVVLVFLVIFGSSMITKHVEKYDLLIDPSTDLSEFETRADELGAYSEGAETESEDITALPEDQETVTGGFGTLKLMWNTRSDVKNVQKSTESNLDFVPTTFWVMISILMGIVITGLIVGLVWRYKEGLH